MNNSNGTERKPKPKKFFHYVAAILRLFKIFSNANDKESGPKKGNADGAGEKTASPKTKGR